MLKLNLCTKNVGFEQCALNTNYWFAFQVSDGFKNEKHHAAIEEDRDFYFLAPVEDAPLLLP